jgi:hypothetical protein
MEGVGERGKGVLVGLIAALAGSLAVTAVVLGHTKKTVIKDARNPNIAAECDIREATAQVVKKGRVARHAVTVRGALPYDNAAPLVWLAKSRTSDLFTEPSKILHPSESGSYHFADNRRTVVYEINKRDLPRAFRQREKYFWFAAVSCGGLAGDDAPNNRRQRQVLKRHDHH